MSAPPADLDTLAGVLARLLLSAWERLTAAETGPENGAAACDQQPAAGTEVRDAGARPSG